MKKILLYISASLLLTSCATYHLSSESLVQQMADTKPERQYIYSPNLPFIPFSVDGNSLHQLKCIDKNGKETTIDVTNRTSVRITLADSSHKTFYFNTLLLKDSTISGSKTHFFEMHIKPILLRDVVKIEVQRS
ncbi:MAG TPA: hypothetical protein VL727_11875 [Puia sp.]|jgi:hypothetical protein|nr:hypothetical protein [Puia sp.]